MIFSPSTLLSKYFKMTYVETCEFSEHLFLGLFMGALGFWLHWSIFIVYAIYSLADEFYGDGHWKVFIGKDPKWKDLLWDLGSKLFGVVLFGLLKI